MDHFDNEIKDWGEQFVLVNGGRNSSKWRPRGGPVEVNDVNIELGRLWRRFLSLKNKALGLFL